MTREQKVNKLIKDHSDTEISSFIKFLALLTDVQLNTFYNQRYS